MEYRLRSFSPPRALTWLGLSALLAVASPSAAVDAGPKRTRLRYPTDLKPYSRKTYPDNGLADTLRPAGRHARGFYLTPYYLHRVGAKKSARIMKRAHMNAVVIDVKDDWGQVLWPSNVPLSKAVQRPLIRNPKAMIKAFHQAGIYVIARIVCFKDSRLPRARPDLSVRFQFDPRRLFHAGAGWIDAYSPEVQDYLIDLALEWQTFGVDEIQLDYIRFPKGHTGTLGLWQHQANDKRSRAQLISAFLERVDRALKLPISAAIYGLTTLVDGDPRRLGQTIEMMSKYVEAISPMMYANGMTSYFKNQTITEWVYELIQCGMWRARQKAPKIVLRPYLQAYPNNVPFFGPNFIRKQVLAVQQAGANGFLFWNSTMRNAAAYRGLRMVGTKSFDAFDHEGFGAATRAKPGPWCKEPGTGNLFEAKRSGDAGGST